MNLLIIINNKRILMNELKFFFNQTKLTNYRKSYYKKNRRKILDKCKTYNNGPYNKKKYNKDYYYKNKLYYQDYYRNYNKVYKKKSKSQMIGDDMKMSRLNKNITITF